MKSSFYNKEDYNWWIDQAVNSAKQIVPFILKHYPIKSVVDFGCAQGGWLSVFQKHGVKKIMGLDGKWVDTDHLLIPKTAFHSVNLASYRHNPKEKYDLCICLEVAEHLNFSISDSLISNLTSASDIILFSAAVPEQGGQHHVNERPPYYWKEKFEKSGFRQLDFLRPRFWDDEEVAWWYKQNIMIYSNKSHFDDVQHVHNDFFGNHLIHPTAFSQKCSELSIENASLRNLIKEVLKRVF